MRNNVIFAVGVKGPQISFGSQSLYNFLNFLKIISKVQKCTILLH